MLIAEVEFRGIQKFLFGSPRLRDMVGANVLLGEMIRRDLPNMAKDHDSIPIDPVAAGLPKCIADDPLLPIEAIDRDDPATLYHMGILSRDGGHFRVCMADGEPDDTAIAKANRFLADADALLRTKAPGLRYDLHLIAVGANGKTRKLSENACLAAIDETMLVASPYFALCAATGKERAVAKANDGSGEPISSGIEARRDAYGKWRNGNAGDIISLMDRWMRDQPGARVHPRDAPSDLLEMCDRDYMAVIYADGNNVGNRAKAAADKISVKDRASFLQSEAAFEGFHLRNRVTLRKALAGALEMAFGVSPDTAGQSGPRPFQLLMLGGDDLLLVCQAKRAMTFVVELARGLAMTAADDWEPLTVGVGVAISAPNLPVNRLVELADDLATSAKRLYRRLDKDGKPCSVVDWHIETGSWTSDIGMHRRSTELVKYGTEACALIQRPVRILEETVPDGSPDLPQLDRLEGLLRAAVALKGSARNKRRSMNNALSNGRRSADFAFSSLPDDLRKVLRTGIGLHGIWRDAGADLWVTPFRDLVDIVEIEYLGTNRADAMAAGSVT